MQVGVISAALKADDKGYTAAIDKASRSLTSLKGSADTAGGALTRLTGAASQNEKAAMRLRERTSQVVGAASSLSGAFGTAGGEISRFGGALTGMLGAFGSGGLFGVAMAGAGIAINAMASQWKSVEEASKKATEEAAKHVATLKSEVADLADEMKALSRGTSIQRLRAERDASSAAGKAQEQHASFVDSFGEEAIGRIGSFRQMADASPSAAAVVAAWEKVEAAALEAGLAQQKLTLMIHKSQLEQLHDEEGKKARGGSGGGSASGLLSPADQDLENARSALRSALEDRSKVEEEAARLVASDMADVEMELAAQADAQRKAAEAAAQLERAQMDLASEMEAQAAFYSDLEAERQLGGAATTVVGAAASGSLGATGGSAVGQLAGGLVGSMFGGAALGEMVGGALGSIMGGTLDQIIGMVGVLAPLFDGLGVALKALTPIFLASRAMFELFGRTLEHTAPLLAAMAEPIAMIMLLAVRMQEPLLLLIDAILVTVAGFWMLLEWITVLAHGLDVYVLQPLVQLARRVYDGWVDVINSLIQWARDLTGNDRLGVMLEHMSQTVTDPYADFAASMEEIRGYGAETEDDLRDAVRDGAKDGVREGLQRSFQNLPGGYKGFANVEFGAADREARSVVINIGTWNTTRPSDDDLQRLRSYARHGTTARSLSRRGLPDRKN